jgi:hypothetical protein
MLTREEREEIRKEGLDALEQRLGRIGMVRFLQVFESGTGNYVVDRREFVEATSLDELRKLAGQEKPKKSRRKH